MTRWSKDVAEFTVSVTFYPHAKSSYASVPKPILSRMGNPKKIRYTIRDDQILISPVD